MPVTAPPQPGFDVQGARAAGASDDDIVSYLNQDGKFDTAGAMKAGATQQDIIDYLSQPFQKPVKQATPPPLTSWERDLIAKADHANAPFKVAAEAQDQTAQQPATAQAAPAPVNGPTFNAPAKLPWYKEALTRAENVVAGPGAALNATLGRVLNTPQPTLNTWEPPTNKPLLDLSALKAEEAVTPAAKLLGKSIGREWTGTEPAAQIARGAISGTEAGLSGLTTPTNLAILLTTGALGKMGAVGTESFRLAVPVAEKLLSAGFSYQQLKDAFQLSPEFTARVRAGDYEGATRIATQIGLSAAFGTLAAKHALSGEGIAPIAANELANRINRGGPDAQRATAEARAQVPSKGATSLRPTDEALTSILNVEPPGPKRDALAAEAQSRGIPVPVIPTRAEEINSTLADIAENERQAQAVADQQASEQQRLALQQQAQKKARSDYADMFDRLMTEREQSQQPPGPRRSGEAPVVPETGVPEDVARGVAARDDVARQLGSGSYAELSVPDKLAVDDLIAQGYRGGPPEAPVQTEQQVAEPEKQEPPPGPAPGTPGFLDWLNNASRESDQWLRDNGFAGGLNLSANRFLDPEVIYHVTRSIAGDVARGVISVRDAAKLVFAKLASIGDTRGLDISSLQYQIGLQAGIPQEHNYAEFQKAHTNWDKAQITAVGNFRKTNPALTHEQAAAAVAGTYGPEPQIAEYTLPPQTPPPPPKAAQKPAVKPPAPPKPGEVGQTAGIPTQPESPATYAQQLQQLREGTRGVVMFPGGQGMPDLSTLGGFAITHDEVTAPDGTRVSNIYVYRKGTGPGMIEPGEIISAARNNKLSEILGHVQLGMGAPDKSVLDQSPHLPRFAVVVNDANGTEVQSIMTNAEHLDRTMAAAQALMPPGGSVRTVTPEQALAERQPQQQQPAIGSPAPPTGGLPGGTSNAADQSSQPGAGAGAPGTGSVPHVPEGNGQGTVRDIREPGYGGSLPGEPERGGGGEGQNIRRVTGSADAALVEAGRQQARDLAPRVANATKVFTAPNKRSIEFGSILNPGARVVSWLKPWFLGAHEGKPLDSEREAINNRILRDPDSNPGVSPHSGEPGESFNQVRHRLIAGIQGQIYDMQNSLEGFSPQDAVLNITSGRALQIINAWARSGQRASRLVDTEAMTSDQEFSKPGELFKLEPDGLKKVDRIDGPGIYTGQHGDTEWNTSEAEAPAEKEEATTPQGVQAGNQARILGPKQLENGARKHGIDTSQFDLKTVAGRRDLSAAIHAAENPPVQQAQAPPQAPPQAPAPDQPASNDLPSVQRRLNDAESDIGSSREQYEHWRYIHDLLENNRLSTAEEEEMMKRELPGVKKYDRQDEVLKRLILAGRRYDEARIGHDNLLSQAAELNPMLARQHDINIKKAEIPVDQGANSTLRDSTDQAFASIGEIEEMEKRGDFDTEDTALGGPADLVSDLKRQLADLHSDIKELEQASPELMATAKEVAAKAQATLERVGAQGYAPPLAALPEGKPAEVNKWLQKYGAPGFSNKDQMATYGNSAVYPLRDGRLVWFSNTMDGTEIVKQKAVPVSATSEDLEPDFAGKQHYIDKLNEAVEDGDMRPESRDRILKMFDRMEPQPAPKIPSGLPKFAADAVARLRALEEDARNQREQAMEEKRKVWTNKEDIESLGKHAYEWRLKHGEQEDLNQRALADIDRFRGLAIEKGLDPKVYLKEAGLPERWLEPPEPEIKGAINEDIAAIAKRRPVDPTMADIEARKEDGLTRAQKADLSYQGGYRSYADLRPDREGMRFLMRFLEVFDPYSWEWKPVKEYRESDYKSSSPYGYGGSYSRKLYDIPKPGDLEKYTDIPLGEIGQSDLNEISKRFDVDAAGVTVDMPKAVKAGLQAMARKFSQQPLWKFPQAQIEDASRQIEQWRKAYGRSPEWKDEFTGHVQNVYYYGKPENRDLQTTRLEEARLQSLADRMPSNPTMEHVASSAAKDNIGTDESLVTYKDGWRVTKFDTKGRQPKFTLEKFDPKNWTWEADYSVRSVAKTRAMEEYKEAIKNEPLTPERFQEDIRNAQQTLASRGKAARTPEQIKAGASEQALPNHKANPAKPFDYEAQGENIRYHLNFPDGTKYATEWRSNANGPHIIDTWQGPRLDETKAKEWTINHWWDAQQDAARKMVRPAGMSDEDYRAKSAAAFTRITDLAAQVLRPEGRPEIIATGADGAEYSVRPTRRYSDRSVNYAVSERSPGKEWASTGYGAGEDTYDQAIENWLTKQDAPEKLTLNDPVAMEAGADIAKTNKLKVDMRKMPGTAPNAPERTGEFDELPQKAEISIPNKQAKDITAVLKKIAGGSRTIPILKNLAIVTKDGQRKLYATDLETVVTFTLPAKGEADSAVTIPVSAFDAALKSKSKENLNVKTDGGRATLSVGGAESQTPTMPISNYPKAPPVTQTAGTIPARSFLHAIDAVFPSISSEESRFTLNGALLELKDGKGKMIATDGHRLSVQEFDAPGITGKHRLLIPRAALDTIGKLYGKETGDLTLKFERQPVLPGRLPEEGQELPVQYIGVEKPDGSVSLLTRQLTGNFPDYERAMPDKSVYTHLAVADREPLLALMKQTLALKGRSNTISLSFRDGQIAGLAKVDEATARGKAPATLERIEGGDPGNPRYAMSARYLADFLGSTDANKVELNLGDDAKTPIVLRPAGDPAHTTLIMPMRGDAEEFDDGFKEPEQKPPASGEYMGSGLGALQPHLEKFAEKDIVPKAKAFVRGLTGTIDTLRRVFAPQTRGETAVRAAGSIREMRAELAHRRDQAKIALDQFRTHFLQRPAEYGFHGLDIYHAIETGETSGLDPDAKAFADTIRPMYDARKKELGDLGLVQHFLQNYATHLYKDPKAAEGWVDDWLTRRPLAGAENFRKQRTYPTLRDALEDPKFTLEPKFDNPVDMVLAGLAQMDKSILAHKKIFNEWRASGDLVYVPSTERAPAGMSRIDDKLFARYLPPTQTISEGFDANLRDRINGLIRSLGLSHERLVNIGGGGQRLGYARKGTGEIVTKFGTPDNVIVHELGHQLEWKYGLSELLKARDYPERTKELRALADLRWRGREPDESYRKYVRNKDEKMANAIDALITHPDLFRKTAPNTWDYLRDELWHKKELRPLFAAQGGSMVLGTGTAEISRGGITKAGDWYAPDGMAQVANNYISPSIRGNAAYDAWMKTKGAANMLNLGFSAFHGLTTALNSSFSDMALGLKQVEAGKPLQAATSISRGLIPFASVVQDGIKGRRLKAVWDGTAQNPTTGELTFVEALKQGGGSPGQAAYNPDMLWDGMKRAWEENNVLGAALRAVNPLLWSEKTMKPIMQKLVPYAKLGAMQKRVQLELDQHPDMDTEEARVRFGRIWDSMDNRFGQLNQRNMLMRNMTRDIMNAVAGRPGWTIGTVREILGGGTDVLHNIADVAHGRKTTMSDRTAYTLAMFAGGALINGLTNAILTGTMPHGLDYITPRDGGTTEDGHPSRIVLPMYLSKDIYSWATKPVATLKAKLAQPLQIAGDIAENRDFYRHKITGEGSVGLGHYLFSGIWPYSAQGLQRNLERSASPVKTVLPMIGIMPASSRAGLSPAEQLITDYQDEQRPTTQAAPTDRTKTETKVFIAAKHGDLKTANQIAQKAVATGIMRQTDVRHILDRAKQTPLVADFKRVTDFPTAMRIFEAASPEEKKLIMREARNKVFAARSKPDLWIDPRTRQTALQYFHVKPLLPRGMVTQPPSGFIGRPAPVLQ